MSFQRCQITLPVVQATPHRSARVLILRVRRPRQRKQLSARRLVNPQRPQDDVYVNNTREQAGSLFHRSAYRLELLDWYTSPAIERRLTRFLAGEKIAAAGHAR